MFPYHKLDVYIKAKNYNLKILILLKNHKLDSGLRDQLKRASLSILLNIAEGTSRFSKKDYKRFIVIARGSAFECAAILEFLVDANKIEKRIFNEFHSELEGISKMLFGLIRNLQD